MPRLSDLAAVDTAARRANAEDRHMYYEGLANAERERNLAERQTLSDIVRETGTDWKSAASRAAAAGIQPKTVMSLQDRAKEAETSERTRKIENLKLRQGVIDKMKYVFDQESYSQWLTEAAEVARITGDAIDEAPPTYDPAVFDRIRERSQTVRAAIEEEYRILSPEETAAAGFSSGTVVRENIFSKEPEVIQKPEKPSKLSVKEVYDPASPTGSRFVSMEDALGMPGKMPNKGVTITGYDEQGRPLIQVGGSSMGTAATNEVEKKILRAGDTLAQLTAIRSRFRPEYQTLGTRIGVAWDRMRDRLNPDSLTADERAELDAFTQYRSEAGQLFALTLKDLSGVAVNPTEFKRAEAWLPNPGTGMLDGDSPAELKAKVDRFEEFTRKALAKAAFVRQHGLTVHDIDLEEIPRTMQRRGDELMAEYRRQGVPDEEARRAVKLRLADEFGLAAY